MNKKKFSFLNQFVGRKVKISNQDTKSTYHYNNFQWWANKKCLALMDGDEPDCKTYIPFFFNDIEDASHLRDVVTIRTTHYTYHICCVEVKKQYVIQDEKGNYLSPESFQKLDNEWLYISYTGRTTGFTAFKSMERAEIVKERLENISAKIGINKGLKVIEVDTANINKGEGLMEEIAKASIAAC